MNNKNAPRTRPHETIDLQVVESSGGRRQRIGGLTKREYFAIKMAAAIRSVGEWEAPEDVASMAVEDADALIKELNRTR